LIEFIEFSAVSRAIFSPSEEKKGVSPMPLRHGTLSQRYDYLSKYANDLILLVHRDGNIVDANDSAVATYGYTREELLRLTIRDLGSPETWQDIPRQMQQVEKLKRLVFETVHKRKDGSTFPAEVSSRLIDLDGQSFFLSVTRDITKRRQAQIALINEKNRSEAIIAAIGDGISIQDRNFKILYQNELHRDMIGDHAGEYCYQAYERANEVCEGCAMAASFKDGRIHTMERSASTHHGITHVEITASPLKNESGEIVAGIEAVRDASARKQAEIVLRERNAFIETILNNLPIGLAVSNIDDGKATYINPKFEEIYGWPKNILADVEQFFASVYPDPVFRKEIIDRIMSDIAGRDPSRMQWDNIPITTQTGETKFVAAVNIPLFEQGLMMSTVLDITARRKSEQRLASLNDCFLSFRTDPDENINRLVALCGESLARPVRCTTAWMARC
jgi:PAS domain S-box-containing protein